MTRFLPGRRRAPDRPGSRFLTSLVALVAATLLAGCGSSSPSSTDTTGVPKGQTTSGSARFAGSRAVPPKPAPPLSLQNSLGQPVNLAKDRGRAVLVTFIYTHCHDVCPLIVSHLRTAQAELGPRAGDLKIIAVSTDPRGDTPKTVAAFLRAHRMTGRMDYLIGSRKQLGRAWKDWNIVAKPAKSGRDLVEHSALIYGISASGNVTTLYPSTFQPAQIVHDVPILASQ
jgi:protein SCO1/2